MHLRIQSFKVGENMQGGVRCILSTLVQAIASKAEIRRVELTPWDLRYLQLGPIQKGLLFPKPKPNEISNEMRTLIHHLETSLSQTLHYFPSLAGRLYSTQHEEDDTVSFYIDCNNAGALFVHAVADGVTVSDIVNPVHVPSIVHSFFPFKGLKNYEGSSNPLLGVQVTELVDGYFLGCNINHCVADGTSFWLFMNSWSEISRGSIQLAKIPVFHRSFSEIINYPIRISKFLVNQFQEESILLPPLKERVFHFTKESIAQLKEKANTEIGTNKISSLQALLSHIWRSTTRNRNSDPDDEMIYFMLIGARSRLSQLPDNYFGNAVKDAVVNMKSKELTEKGIGYVAWQMNRIIATQTEDEFKRDLKDWIANPKIISMTMAKTNAMVTSSSPRFNMYGNDFGWGKPIAVRSGGGNKFDGKITLFPGIEEGSIDAEACILTETLDGMSNDQEFMDAVTK